MSFKHNYVHVCKFYSTFCYSKNILARWRSIFLSWAENSDILNFVEKKEYVHIEYSGPLTRLSSVLCKTLYTYIYLGGTKLHICKKKLATSYVLQKKNFLALVILKFRFSKKATKVCQDLSLLL